MKERPILMTPENAQKCHDGTKTQTRRAVKDFGSFHNGVLHCGGKHGLPKALCPYGVVGDRLWVREAWQEKAWSLTDLNHAGCLDAPKNPSETYLGEALYVIHKYGYNQSIGDVGPWKPSIHMPRWACRTVLEIAEIRVERLQEISEDDAKAEGVTRIDQGREYYFSAMRSEPDHRNWVDPTDAYKELWESINGVGSWSQNPWVWVITFRNLKEHQS